MKRTLLLSTAVCVLIFQPETRAQSPMQQKMADVKAAVAANQAALKHYIWTEQTNILLKGEVKKTTNYQCMYGPDGKVQKTATGGSPPPQQKGGLRGRIVERKTDEMTEYMQNAVGLIKNYVPPNPQQMQIAFQSGNATLGMDGPAELQIQFHNYVKQGDSMVFFFNKATKSLSQITVNTYMNDQSDAVSLQVAFSTLPGGGPNYVSQTTLNAPAKNIVVQTTSSNYQRMAQ